MSDDDSDDDSDDASDDDKGPDLEAGVEASTLPNGGTLAGTFRGEAVVLVDDDGRVCAWSGECTHLGAPLADGLVVDGTLRCPWHHARFSLATGEAIAAPAFAPLARFDVETRDGRIVVTGRHDAANPSAHGDAPPARIVVVGGGAAGFACAEMLARCGHGRAVTVVSDDAEAPYDRTACSKQYLIGQSSRDAIDLAGDLFGGDEGPTLRLGEAVRAIDVGARVVVLDGGGRVPFDALVLATGAEPKRPDAPGFDRPNVHVLRTLADADALVAASRSGGRAVVVGASFIGLEAAASLTQRDVEVHVVAPDDVPLKDIVGADVGRMIRGVHEEQGVRFHPGREAMGFDGRRMTLDDGTILEADFVVLGVGVTPRTALAEAAGLEVAPLDDGGGIVVNGALETSVAGIFAVGDCARYPDRHAGRPIRVEHWVHAQRQGQFVARRMMGLADRYDDLPFFWSAHFDTGLRAMGHVAAIRDMRVDGSIDGRSFAIRYDGTDGERASATCNRDRAALVMEADQEREGR